MYDLWKSWKKYIIINSVVEEGSGGGSSNSDDGKGSGSKEPSTDKDPEGSGSKEGKPGKKDQDDSGSSLDKLPDWAQKEIKSLRSESAKHRTDNKSLRGDFDGMKKGIAKALGFEDEDIKPEEKIADLNSQNGSLEFQNAVLSVAVQNGISGDQLEYFTFLMEKACSTLKDDEELADEDMNKIIQKAKGQGKKFASSSVDDNDPEGDGGTPPPGGSDDVTLEEFNLMNMLDRSKLYREKPDTYDRLVSQAKAKGSLV